MSRHEEIQNAYKSLGGEATFYDGMITCSTLSGTAVCRLVWNMGNLFVQITAILWIEGLFDRIFIDWYWVCKTKAWLIPGTEDCLPYIPKKAFVKKWMATIIGYPILAAILSGICLLF